MNLQTKVSWIIVTILVYAIPIFGGTSPQLDLDNPDLGSSEKPEKPSIGPLQNIVFGGAFDSRLLAPNGQKAQLLIHVNELVMTATVGDNISILAEQLLPTSELVSAVGQDHGFVYAIFSNYPFLPSGMAIKVGRFRAKWGYDARSDSPVNPIQSLAIKHVGEITGTGIEVSGYLSDSLDYNVAIHNGPDTLFVDTVKKACPIIAKIPTLHASTKRCLPDWVSVYLTLMEKDIAGKMGLDLSTKQCKCMAC